MGLGPPGSDATLVLYELSGVSRSARVAKGAGSVNQTLPLEDEPAIHRDAIKIWMVRERVRSTVTESFTTLVRVRVLHINLGTDSSLIRYISDRVMDRFCALSVIFITGESRQGRSSGAEYSALCKVCFERPPRFGVQAVRRIRKLPLLLVHLV